MEETFNQAEAGLWILIAMVLFVRAIRAHGPIRRVFFFLSPVFLVFGFSDLVEARTGSWWDPWWLAAVKVACVAAMIMGFRRYYAISKRQRRP